MVHYSPEQLVEALRSFDVEKLCDNNLGEFSQVQAYSLDTSVYYHKILTPMFIANRDACLYMHCYKNEKGQTVLVTYSGEHEKVPLVKKNVRSHMALGGYIMTPLANGRTHVLYQVQIDIKMKLPKVVQDMFNRKHGYKMHYLQEVLDKLNKK